MTRPMSIETSPSNTMSVEDSPSSQHNCQFGNEIRFSNKFNNYDIESIHNSQKKGEKRQICELISCNGFDNTVDNNNCNEAKRCKVDILSQKGYKEHDIWNATILELFPPMPNVEILKLVNSHIFQVNDIDISGEKYPMLTHLIIGDDSFPSVMEFLVHCIVLSSLLIHSCK